SALADVLVPALIDLLLPSPRRPSTSIMVRQFESHPDRTLVCDRGDTGVLWTLLGGQPNDIRACVTSERTNAECTMLRDVVCSDIRLPSEELTYSEDAWEGSLAREVKENHGVQRCSSRSGSQRSFGSRSERRPFVALRPLRATQEAFIQQ